MKHTIYVLFCILILASCGAKKPTILSSSTNPKTTSSNHIPFFDVTEYSKDEEYGLVNNKPVKVGEKSAQNQRRYLASFFSRTKWRRIIFLQTRKLMSL